MRRTVHRSLLVYGLALTLALLLAWIPLGLNPAPPQGLQLLPIGPQLQGFWETVLQLAGR